MTAAKSAVATVEAAVATNAAAAASLDTRVSAAETFVLSATDDLADHETRIGDLEAGDAAAVTADAIATAIGASVGASDGAELQASLAQIYLRSNRLFDLADSDYSDATDMGLSVAGTAATDMTAHTCEVNFTGTDCTIGSDGTGPVVGTATSLTSPDALIVATVIVKAGTKMWLNVQASGLDETIYWNMSRGMGNLVSNGETRTGQITVVNCGLDCELNIWSYADTEGDTMSINAIGAYLPA
jgi:hypothetical protein